ncbi:MAG: aldehyde dehydrogenase family protein [Myxococcota bacterium]
MTAEAVSPSPSSTLDAAREVESLRRVFNSRLTRSREWRERQLDAVIRFCKEEERAIAEALEQDLGKPPLDSFASEIVFVINEAKHAKKHLAEWMATERVATPLTLQPARSEVHWEPLGVALVISPWNYPFQLAVAPLVAALAAGCCVLIKPSEVAPHTSRLLAERLTKYVDGGAVRIIEGGVPETTAILAEPFDHIFYTGNGRVARIIMAAAAKHLTPVTLELGGKSPCIVDASADLDLAARRIVWGKYFNAGQTCVAPDYVLAEESIHDALLSRIVSTLREFYGDDPQASPDYARIISERHHDRLVGLLEGATLVVGGEHQRSDRYLAPTVVRDVDRRHPVMGEEIFGPILPFLSVANIDDALRFVQQGDKPLALYLFSGERSVQERVLAETSSGGAAINHVMAHLAVPDLPFGGVGPSGMGAYHGRWGFETFSHRKAVLRASTVVDSAQLLYPPTNAIKDAIARKVL